MKRQDKSEFKTLWITKNSHDRIAKIGRKDETYDQVVNRILNVYDKFKDVYTEENGDEEN